MSKMIYQNENAVLNHLGVRKLVTITYRAEVSTIMMATPAEVKKEVDYLKSVGATKIKVK